MGWFDGNLKQENKFIAMLIGQAAKSVEAIHYLVHTLEQIDLDTINAVHTLAEEASELRRVLIDELHKTFITPLDREDIFNLSHCFEDMVTYALTTVEEMNILKVDADDYIREMTKLVRQRGRATRTRDPAPGAESARRARSRARSAQAGTQSGTPVSHRDQGSVRARHRSGGSCLGCSTGARSTATYRTCPIAPIRPRTCSAWSS